MTSQEFEFIHSDLPLLYGKEFYIVPGEKPAEEDVDVTTESHAEKPEKELESSAEPGIVWRTKPASQVLFILHQAELKDKELGELLKKIVQSIGIPFEAAGFGIIVGEVNQSDFDSMPNPFGVLFDHEINPGDANPLILDDKEIYFAHMLEVLRENQNFKRELWGNLKLIKEKL